MSDLKDYLEQANDLPDDILLGRIVVYTIYDHPIELTDVQKWFADLNLEPQFIPQPNKRHDSFKKATKELDKISYPLSGGRTAILLCRDVATNSQFINRHIIREIRDSRSRKLNHDKAIDCYFHRGGEQFQHPIFPDHLEPEELPYVKDAARSMKTRYDYHTKYLDNMKIRAMVRGYLKHLNCVEIKPGVYFVHHSRDDELHRLAELVNRLGGGCHMNMLPLVNIEREREFITKMFERDAVNQLETLTKEIEGLVADRKKISPKIYAKMEARFTEVMGNATEHMITLDVTQDLTAAQSEIAQKALREMQIKMLSEG